MSLLSYILCHWPVFVNLFVYILSPMNDQHLQSWRKTITKWIPSVQQQFSHLHGLLFFYLILNFFFFFFLLYARLQSNLFNSTTSVIYLQLKSNVHLRPKFEMLVSSRFWWHFLLCWLLCTLVQVSLTQLPPWSISFILSLGSRSVLLTLQLEHLLVVFGHAQEFWNTRFIWFVQN